MTDFDYSVQDADDMEGLDKPEASSWYPDIVPSDGEFVAGVRLAFIRLPGGDMGVAWSFEGALSELHDKVNWYAQFARLRHEFVAYIARLAEEADVEPEPELRPAELTDDDLPGMWSTSDFMGGEFG